GAKGIRDAYETGRGRVSMRARAHFEPRKNQPDREAIIVTELPYQVNKASLLEKIAELVRDKRVEGITELRDESDKRGMRVVIELRRGEVPEVVLNNLYQHTQLQTVFGVNMVALMDGQPRLLNLKEIIEAFIRHRREVVTRRTLFDLAKSRDRAHILEGLAVALANIDPIIALIKAAPSPAEAKQGLLSRAWEPGVVVDMLDRAGASVTRPEELADAYGLKDDGYHLSETQAQAILDLRLHRLTGLEQEKITNEYKELIDKIQELLKILSSPGELMKLIREELVEVREQYGDARRTEIVPVREELNPEDLITEEEVVVTFSHSGYVKTQPLSAYRAQRRGGRGKAATTMKEEDFVDRMFVASTHDTVLCFSSHGKVYWLKTYELPQGSRAARGRPILNLLPLAEDERINTILPIRDYEEGKFIFMATNLGVVKKTPLRAFSRPRTTGLIAIELQPTEYLIGAA
ncbi:MAG TPA: DNA gyrase subunit A, partial [Pseudodesulfovibrio sp.]|nr:DNA gyrase subunit A [Pseudodesulfovibrio sp.]